MINRNIRSNDNDDLDNDFHIEEKITRSSNKKSKAPITKKTKITMIIWLVIMIFVFYEVIRLGLYTIGKVDKDSMWLYNGVNGVVNFILGGKDQTTTEEFSMKIAGLGDIYFTSNTLSGAKEGTNYDFTTGTDAVKNILQGYDFVIASLNTPIANKSLGYSSKSLYNAPESVLDMLKSLNIKMLATGTSHILDKNTDGLDQTITALQSAGIKQIGISSTERNKPQIIEKDKIKIGVLSYATKSNVKYKDDNILNVLNDEDLKKDIEYLKSQNVDFIISYLNVPDEDAIFVNGIQKSGVETLFNAGVNAVFGTGSMIVQEDDEDEITIGEEKSHVYTIYSLGDFMGSYATDENKTSVIANLEFTKKLTKNKKGEVTKEEKDMKIKTPIGIYTTVDKNYKKKLYVIDDEIAAYDQKKSDITEKEYNSMKTAQTKINKLYQ